jgi:hypothetical protein
MEYVPDVAAALAEAYGCCVRVGGCSCWTPTGTPLSGTAATPGVRRVLAAWDQHLVVPYLPRTLTGGLGAGPGSR